MKLGFIDCLDFWVFHYVEMVVGVCLCFCWGLLPQVFTVFGRAVCILLVTRVTLMSYSSGTNGKTGEVEL
jgi:hypothetical protein